MKLPKFLKPGDTIGLVAPSFGANTEPYHTRLKSAINYLHEEGFKTKVFGDIFGYYMGASESKEKRAKAFMDAYTDKDINAIFSVSGGEMMFEILPLIDFEELKKHEPKFFIGYSDNTNLTFLLPTLIDVVSVYAPCLTTFGMKPLDPFLVQIMGLLKGKKITQHASKFYEPIDTPEREPLAPYSLIEKTKWINLFGEENLTLKGRVIGGCLEVLVSLVGTPYDNVKNFIKKYKDDNIIWFLEVAEFNLFGYKKALWQLKEAGWFNNTKAILFGRSAGTKTFIDMNLYDVTKDILKDLNIPVIMDMDIGHVSPVHAIFTGAKIEVENTPRNSFVKFNLT